MFQPGYLEIVVDDVMTAGGEHIRHSLTASRGEGAIHHDTGN